MKCISLALALAALSLANPAHALCLDGDFDKSFNAVVKRTFKAIKARDAASLVDIFSRDGVKIGADGVVVSYADLQAQFSQQGGSYCTLFSCATQPGLFSRLNDGISVSKSWNNNFLTVTGRVLINNGSVARNLELDYSLNAQCQWQLDALIYQ